MRNSKAWRGITGRSTNDEIKNNSNMQLPKINLNGVDYFIDHHLREFRMVNNPHRFFSFDMLKDEGSFYTIKFIKGTDNIIAGSGLYEYGSLIECDIPFWAIHDEPKEISNKN